MYVVLGALALVMSLASCGQSDEQSGASSTTAETEPPVNKEPTYIEELPSDIAADLVGTEWTLVSLYGSPPLESSNVALYIEDDGIGGSTGCNYYGSKDVTMDKGRSSDRQELEHHNGLSGRSRAAGRGLPSCSE